MAKKVVSKKAGKKEEVVEVEEPVQQEVQETPVETHEEVSQDETSDETLEAQVDAIIKMASAFIEVGKKILKESTSVKKRIAQQNKKIAKLENKSKNSKKRSGDNVLSKPQPVYSEAFQQFVEANHASLTDKNGKIIIETLQHDADGHLLIGRGDCLRLVTAYVRKNNLQYETERKRIKMDATLAGLFPDHAEKKDKKGKITQEENLYFHTLMGALSPHLKDPSETKTK